MKNLNALLRFVVYHVVALVITVPIMLYIVYSLQNLILDDALLTMQRGQTAAANDVLELPTFTKWLNGDGDNTGILNGGWGDLFQQRRPVAEMLSERLPVTLELVQYTLLFALPIGILLGMVMALLRSYLSDAPLSILAHVALAVPVFVLALLLIQQLVITQQQFPATGRCAVTAATCDGADWAHLTLPLASLVIFWSGAVALYVRDAILHVARQERETGIGIKHIFAGVLIFVPMSAGVMLAGLLSHVVLVETIFAYPGWGRLLVDGTASRDYPILIAISTQMALVCALVYTAGSLIGGLFAFVFGIEPRGYTITHHPTLAAVQDGTPSMIETQPANGLQRLFRRLGTAAALVAVVFIIGVTAAGVINSSGKTVTRQNLQDNLQPPSAAYAWGTDNIGRDLQVRTLAGAWISLKTAGGAALLALLIGGVVGILGGILDGGVGALLNFPINRYASVLTLLPVIPFALLVVSITGGSEGFWLLFGVLGWTTITPLVRAQIRAIRTGSDDATGLLAVLLYGFFWNLAAFLAWEVALGFLGFSDAPPTPSLGNLLSEGVRYLANAPHMIVPAGLLLTGLIFACYMITGRIAATFDFLQPASAAGIKSKRNLTAETLFPDTRF